jgi:hypothetical protein
MSLAELEAKLTATTTAYNADHDGVMVFINDVTTGSTITQTAGITSKGIYYFNHDGTTGEWYAVGENKLWSTTGNANTDETADFIGTTDEMALNFRVDNVEAGRIGIDGDRSVFLGFEAGLSDNLIQTWNTFVGYQAGRQNLNGLDNTAVGYRALRSNTSGSSNTAFGNQVLLNNSEGNQNTANGFRSLFSNIANSRSTAFGYDAMYYADNRTSGRDTYNTAVGYEALRGSTTAANNRGRYNTAVGDQALYSNTDGGENVALGVQALYYNTLGIGNTASGYRTLYSNTTGIYNSAFGDRALYFNTTGNNNTATGRLALYTNISGNNNTAMGYNALSSNTIGHRNVAIGRGAGANNLFGSDNIYIGFEAGNTASLSENDKLYINNEKSITPLIYGEFDNNTLTINGSTTVNGATTVYESNNSASAHAIRGIKTHTGDSDAYGVYGENTVSDDHGTGVHGKGGRIGVYGIAVTNGNDNYYGLFGDISGSSGTRVGVRGQAFGSVGFRYGVYSVGDLLYTGTLVSASDRKLKSNIKTLINAMETIMYLKPSTYNFKERYQEIMLASDKPQFGFMAQDVQAILPELVSENKYSGTNKGDEEITFLGINYIGLIPILTAGIQEQELRIQSLEAKITLQNQTIEALAKRLERLEAKLFN